jgi:DNA-binding NtrC family response regulator
MARGTTTARPGAEQEEGEMIKPARILIVDDEPIVGERLKAFLVKDGYQVVIFADPKEAMARLEREHFDIVISDIRMGEMSGIQIMEWVVAHSPDSIVVIITGYATIELARESLAKGAFDFIAKPFKLKEIRKTVQKALEHLDNDTRASGGRSR